ncbi:MAG: SDR family NAD(P)-dependent oxidoreductase [Thermoguttaceae bacterium]|jgi:NAD(P)-dependent dehydrogenase (short-subunit alcohol dehydrogenase family)|nr:SDR family NAD(P)-dependent oxidoreductase [Thermoguttaceae bacterium]
MPDARAILITGASTGIGEACALELDRRGFRVFAGVRSAEAGEALRSKASSNLVCVHLDVTDPRSIAEAADAIDAAVGALGLWGLVNNAGIVVHGPVEIVALDELRRQFEVNVIGQVAVTQKMLRLVRRARGRIVNMGSVSGFVSAPHLGPYAASKHALEALSDSLRVELARFGIGVSIVEPQSIRTPIWTKARASADALVRGLTPQAEELYGKEMRLVGRAVERFEARGLPVERVVRAVVHALTAPKPKPRYPVGLQTRLAYLLWHLLPTSLRDAILRRETGLG